MQVILIESVAKLGKVGDEVHVKDGFARNYLLPRGIALRATNENRKAFDEQRQAIEKKNKDAVAAAEKLSAKVNGLFVNLIRQAGEDGRLFGSVGARDIADRLASLGFEVSREKISLDTPIKNIGVLPVRVILHADVIVNVNVNVSRTEAEAESQKKEFLNPTVKKEETVEQVEAAEVSADEQQNEEPSAE